MSFWSSMDTAQDSTVLPSGSGWSPGERATVAMALMRQHLESGIGMSDVAGACGLSYCAFIRTFKQAIGLPPRQWFIALRLERALELMQNPTYTLADVAQMAGFCDQSAFTHAFSRKMGASPARWRRVHGESLQGRLTRPIVETA